MSIFLQAIFAVVALFLCVIPHEVAHGLVALWLGDPTAKRAGRLSLNPLRHLDPIGSVLLPLALILVRRFTGVPLVVFGWAKPVPINPYYFRDPWRGMVWVGLAGPTTNILLAAFAAGLGRALYLFGARNPWVFMFLALFTVVSLLIAFFNLIPLPPLDGSRVLTYFLPTRWRFNLLRLEQFGIIIVIALVLLGVLDIVLRGAETFAVYLLGVDLARLSGLWW
ncbi:MAG: site-2 protease family protein [Candidatus Bipolaricaulota bacterium]|nr:site-2 protease family protein [Candidatus Bipolaricaulota bacterium]MDW8126857.1 site-2 protease family protein [Candidatus Bipolaricaulota bacterium]